jgi:hypothetical protein
MIGEPRDEHRRSASAYSRTFLIDIRLGITSWLAAARTWRIVSASPKAFRLVIGELGKWSTWAVRRRIKGWLGSPLWRHGRFRTARELKRLAEVGGLTPGQVHGAIYYPHWGLTAHIRRISQGEREYRDTQPFVRELGGRKHTFAHNSVPLSDEPWLPVATGRCWW